MSVTQPQSARERACRRGRGRALLAASLALISGCSDSTPSSEPGAGRLPAGTPVILVIIDTLRADHLGTYGHELDTSPRLDAFAEHAYVFENNLSQCNATMPSIISILTGTYVRTHRNYVSVPVDGLVRDDAELSGLPELLQERGYYTAGVASHPGWNGPPASPGLARGWDSFSVVPQPEPGGDRNLLAHADVTNPRLHRALDEYERLQADGSDRPLFLWAHYFDPHTDLANALYNPPAPFTNRFLEHYLREAGGLQYLEALAPLSPADMHAWIQKNVRGPERRTMDKALRRALYDAEIASCDVGVDQLFQRLRDMGLYDDALIIVVADHGENLDENESAPHAAPFTHRGLREGVVHTPLIIRLPGQAQGARMEGLTQSIDVTPTILDLLGLPEPERAEGRSLVPLMTDPSAAFDTLAYSESSDNMEQAVKDSSWKYVTGRDGTYLFDWREDPTESIDRAGSAPADVLQRFEHELARFKPKECLQLRLTPGAEHYDAEIEIRFSRSRVLEVVGVSGAVSEDGLGFHATVRVEDEPVDVLLFPERRHTWSAWRIRSDPAGPASGGVWLGQFPVERTTAIPTYRPGASPAPADPLFAVTTGTGSVHAEFSSDTPTDYEVELRYRRPNYPKRFELLENTGFSPPAMEPPPAYVTRARGMRRAGFSFEHDPAEEVLLLPRIDGTWPPTERVSVDGMAADPRAVEFEIPWPLDNRITTLLLAGPRNDPPPGALQIWLENSAGAITIDPALLDEEQLRQLRALGYVDGPAGD